MGDVFQQALRNKWIDSKAEFAIPRPRPKPKPEPEAVPQWPGAEAVFDAIRREFGRIFR